MPYLTKTFARWLALGASTAAVVAAAAADQDIDERWRLALRLARETNKREFVAAVESIGRDLKQEPDRATLAKFSEIERRLGIDPGGWSMAGQPIFRPTATIRAQLPGLALELEVALRSNDPNVVRGVTRKMLQVLGDQAGIPDARRIGRRMDAKPIDTTSATKLFIAAVKSEEPRLRPLLQGQPMPEQMVRLYGTLLDSDTRLRPLAALHSADDVAWLDRLGEGTATVLLALQQPDGHFPFPDLRGKNIRFGAMTDKALAAGSIEVRAGWVISVDPEGGSQFDTGVAGTALLWAGKERTNAAWVQAGRRAADWALTQPCCVNFNYNAFSVSLLAHAYAVTGETSYLEGAWSKFRVGIAPGQAPNGRWLDAHNARTVYHVIILRALADLATVLPTQWNEQRDELEAVLRPAVNSLLNEFEAMGITIDALPDLLALRALYPNDARLSSAIAATAAIITSKCTDGRRVKLGVSPDQLAAVATLGQR